MSDDSSDHEMPEVPSISSIRFCTNLQSIDFWWWSLEFPYTCPWKHTDHRNLSPLPPMWPACSCALWLMLVVVKTSDCRMFCSGCALWGKGWCSVFRPINTGLAGGGGGDVAGSWYYPRFYQVARIVFIRSFNSCYTACCRLPGCPAPNGDGDTICLSINSA